MFKINLLNYHAVSKRVVLVIQTEGHVTEIVFVRFCVGLLSAFQLSPFSQFPGV